MGHFVEQQNNVNYAYNIIKMNDQYHERQSQNY
jgi:hypothetical protein